MKNKRPPLPMAMITAMMLAQSSEGLPSRDMAEDLPEDMRERAPWYKVQLSKAERRGKTPDEIRALRRAKWEAECRAK